MKKIIMLSIIVASSLYSDEPKKLEPVTITAQKIEESTQDVPITMSIFDEASVEDKNLVDLQDMSYFVPNFYLFGAGDTGAFSPTIRGVSAIIQTGSSAVGLYVDGVATTNSFGFNSFLNDVERVEVLRGPQGTLYGKNTEVGVINIVTKKPDNNFAGKAILGYGEDNRQNLGINLRTPLIKDKLFLGLSGQYYAKNGMMKSDLTKKRVDDRKKYFGKLYLRAIPNDMLELSLISSFLKHDDGSQRVNRIGVLDYNKFYGNAKEYLRDTDETHSFKIKYLGFDLFDIESITSYKKYYSKYLSDQDGSLKTMRHATVQRPFTSISEELKLNGEVENLKWLFGLSLGWDKDETNYKIHSENPKNRGEIHRAITTKGYGVFTHINYSLTDKLNFIGGIRYDMDKKEFTDYNLQQKRNFNSKNVSPKIAFNYKWNENFSTFLSVAKGYRNGGFNINAKKEDPITYKSENIWNYEIGSKSLLLDGKLLLNSNIFYMDLNNKQEMIFGDDYFRQSYITNATSGSSYGVEIDANYQMSNNLNLFATFGYNEAKFDNFKDSLGNYNNKNIPFAPKYNYSLGAKYRGLGGFYASAIARGYGKMYLDNSNKYAQNSYTLVDTKIGYEWNDFDIYLYANNLFDTNYDYKGYAGSFVFLNPQREVGVKFIYRF